MLQAKDVHIRLGSKLVLNGATIVLNPGELVGLIGASGAGKTVFARCIVGLEDWHAGELVVDDVVVTAPHGVDDASWSAVRRKVGLVAQNRGLPPYRRVVEQVAEGPVHVLGLSQSETRNRVANWLERLGIVEHIDKYPAELSGGELARVCLARALVMEPAYLICDEVTANLDPGMAAEVARALLKIVKTGVGVLMISHQIEFLSQHATRVDYLEAGRVVATGDADAMLRNPHNDGLKQFLSAIALGR